MHAMVENRLAAAMILIITMLIQSRTGGVAILSPSGKICIHPGDQLLFMCQVSARDHNPQTNWLIHFEEPSLSNVSKIYISKDPLGQVQGDIRNEYNFTFNLTFSDNSTSVQELISTLYFTITNTTSPLHQAIISCSNGEQNEKATLHICSGVSPSSTIELTNTSSDSRGTKTVHPAVISTVETNISDVPIDELRPSKSSKMGYFIALGVVASGIIVVVLVSIVVLLRKGLQKHQESCDSHVPNHYSDLPLSAQINSVHPLNITDYDVQGQGSMQSGNVHQVTYASISQHNSQANKNGVPHCDLSLALDDRVDYVEVRLQSGNNDHINRDDAVDINLNSLLIQLRSHVTPMWKEFGLVIGIVEEVLDRYSSYPPEECLVEVLDYWLRKYHTAENKLTWRDVAEAVKEIGLHQLAENILNVYQTGQLPIQVDMETSTVTVSKNQVQSHDHTIEQPPPLPPKMAKGVQRD